MTEEENGTRGRSLVLMPPNQTRPSIRLVWAHSQEGKGAYSDLHLMAETSIVLPRVDSHAGWLVAAEVDRNSKRAMSGESGGREVESGGEYGTDWRQMAAKRGIRGGD
ncbi:MAG: hypothetical protein GY927_12640 [bacterium]|nr:hypothetical protein [bacterium]